MTFCSLQNKTFLVTGASSGVGRQTAIQLDALGAQVVLSGRNIERLEETKSMLLQQEHIIAPADITTVNYTDWLKKIKQEISYPLYGIAHCAGEHKYAPLRGYSSEKLLESINNFTIPLVELFIEACRLKEKDMPLSLVFMSSISSQKAIIGNALYGASRAAAESLCRSIAVEFASRSVRCNAVCGGYMENSLMIDGLVRQLGNEYIDKLSKSYPLGLGKTKDAANMITFLLSDMSSWITGQIFIVDGGNMVKGV